jgi:hypothetical protein
MKKTYLLVVALLLGVVVAVSGQDWVSADTKSSAAGAFQAGNEADGTPVYIIRSPFGGGLTVGKFIPKAKAAYVPWGGLENPVTRFELYVGTGRWLGMKATDPIPPDAVAGGQEADGSRLLIIRAPQGQALVPGKYSEKFNKAYVPWGGKEVEVSRFEMLVADAQPVGYAPGMWVPADVTNNASAAFPSGTSPDGTPSYLIRSPFRGGLVPGKYNPKAKKAYVPWGGLENSVTTFELYVGRGTWVPGSPAGPPPHNAVAAGSEADGTPLLAIRSKIDKAVVPGKFNVKTKEASVSLGGKEVKAASFEFLVEERPMATRPAPAARPANPPPVEAEPADQGDPNSAAYQVWKYLSFTQLSKPSTLALKGGALSINGELATTDSTLNKRALDSYRNALDQEAEFMLTVSWPGKRSDFQIFLFDDNGTALEPSAVDDTRILYYSNRPQTGTLTLAVMQATDKLPVRYGADLQETTFTVEGELGGDTFNQESIVPLALSTSLPFWHLEVGGEFTALFDVRDGRGKVLARSEVLDDTDHVSALDFTPAIRGPGDVRISTKLPTENTHWKLYVRMSGGS